jgi:ABC-type bacteriocin/lantibiotic exporter with double-glycine peptidase domain
MSPILLPVPHIQQHNSGECLVACAAMLLNYLGISVSYDRLFRLLKVRPLIGTPSSNIREVRKLRVNVIYQQGTLAELYTHLAHNQPCIAFVRSGELPYWTMDTDHAVVVVGIDDQSVYLNDPEFPHSPIQVSQGDFDLAWLEWDELYTTFSRRG